MLRLITFAKDKHVNKVMRDVTVIVLKSSSKTLAPFLDKMMLVLKLIIN